MIAVCYPGLDSFPQRELAKRQLKIDGGLLTFDLAGGLEAGRKFVEGDPGGAARDLPRRARDARDPSAPRPPTSVCCPRSSTRPASCPEPSAVSAGSRASRRRGRRLPGRARRRRVAPESTCPSSSRSSSTAARPRRPVGRGSTASTCSIRTYVRGGVDGREARRCGGRARRSWRPIGSARCSCWTTDRGHTPRPAVRHDGSAARGRCAHRSSVWSTRRSVHRDEWMRVRFRLGGGGDLTIVDPRRLGSVVLDPDLSRSRSGRCVRLAPTRSVASSGRRRSPSRRDCWTSRNWRGSATSSRTRRCGSRRSIRRDQRAPSTTTRSVGCTVAFVRRSAGSPAGAGRTPAISRPPWARHAVPSMRRDAGATHDRGPDHVLLSPGAALKRAHWQRSGPPCQDFASCVAPTDLAA